MMGKYLFWKLKKNPAERLLITTPILPLPPSPAIMTFRSNRILEILPRRTFPIIQRTVLKKKKNFPKLNKSLAKVQYHSLAFDLLNTNNRQVNNSAAHSRQPNQGTKFVAMKHYSDGLIFRVTITIKLANNLSTNKQTVLGKTRTHFGRKTF